VRARAPRSLGHVNRAAPQALAQSEGAERLRGRAAAPTSLPSRFHQRDRALEVAIVDEVALADDDTAGAELADEVHVVAHDHEGLALFDQLSELALALLAEGCVSDRQDLIDQ